LQQQRSLAAAESTLIADLAQYATDRASLEQILADTLEKYGINVGDAVAGKMNSTPTIPGLQPASTANPATANPATTTPASTQ
jgi:hypothetical protein